MKPSESPPRPASEIALIVGAGPGLGAALARHFGAAKMRVVIAARHERTLREVMDTRVREGIDLRGVVCDATREHDVTRLFASVERELGTPDLVVHNAGRYAHGGILDTEPDTFEACWRVGCFAGFLVGRAAARAMLQRGRGTIVFTGATASWRGGDGYAALAVEKFGVRALAQSMARELGPRGIHVAHVIVDGHILSERFRDEAEKKAPDSLLAPGGIAETYLHLHLQHRSAWTQELDLRPWVERF